MSTYRGDLILRSGTRVMVGLRRTPTAWVTTKGVRYDLRTGQRKGAPADHRLDAATVCRMAAVEVGA